MMSSLRNAVSIGMQTEHEKSSVRDGIAGLLVHNRKMSQHISSLVLCHEEIQCTFIQCLARDNWTSHATRAQEERSIPTREHSTVAAVLELHADLGRTVFNTDGLGFGLDINSVKVNLGFGLRRLLSLDLRLLISSG